MRVGRAADLTAVCAPTGSGGDSARTSRFRTLVEVHLPLRGACTRRALSSRAMPALVVIPSPQIAATSGRTRAAWRSAFPRRAAMAVALLLAEVDTGSAHGSWGMPHHPASPIKYANKLILNFPTCLVNLNLGSVAPPCRICRPARHPFARTAGLSSLGRKGTIMCGRTVSRRIDLFPTQFPR